MSVLALTGYKSIESNLFVDIAIGNPVTSHLLFSDRLVTTTIGGNTYTGLGKLLAITSSSSEIRTSSNEVTLTISGIPNSSISEIVNSEIKGSPIVILRGLFDATNGAFLSGVTGNPVNRFNGFVNNLALQEDFDPISRSSSNTLVMSCASNVDILDKKIAGRKTNPSSQKVFFPTDISMDRVPNIENSYFDFGAKK